MSDNHQLPKSPYVGLMPFSEEDAQFFFGREKERDIIIENLRASRLTVLYGASGVGKSSVLNAGVVYSLNQLAHRALEEHGKPEFAVVIFSDWSDDPIARFMQSVQKAVAKTLQVENIEAVPDSGDIVEMLKTWSERFGLELLIILDQFEEYFNYLSNEKTDNSFAAQLPRAINDLNLRAKFIISLREDSLAKLDRFKPEIPYIFDNTFRLEHMNVEAARDAIKKPLDTYNKIYITGEDEEKFEIEPELINEIIVQLTNPESSLTSESQNEILLNSTETPIEAPYLQLVMTRLWEKEQSENSHVLRLDTLKTLEGLKNIVQSHLNSAMDSLPQDQREIAADIFKYLVTSSGTKIAYTEADLAASADVHLDKLSPVLEMLNQSRILRLVDPPLNRPNESRYEVFHDVLAKAILKWRSEYVQRRKLEDDTRKRKADENAKLFRYGFVAAGIVLLLLSGLTIFALNQWKGASDEKKKADAQREIAEAQFNEAEKQRVIAKAQQTEAEKQREIAKEQQKEAQEQKNIAEEERKRADIESQEAKEQAELVKLRQAEVEKAKEALEEKNKDLGEAVIKQEETNKYLEEAVKKEKEANKKIQEQVETIQKQKGEAEELAKIAIASKEEAILSEKEATLLATKLSEELADMREVEKKLKKLIENIKDQYVRDEILSTLQVSSEDPLYSNNNPDLSPESDPIAKTKWQNGKTLHIKFMDGEPAIQKKVEEIAQEWNKYANLKFVFDSSPKAEIRITFDDIGSWSYMGTDALIIPQDTPTMNLGILKLLSPNDEQFRRSVLHEFGHVLGLIHEHQQANANIPWNQEAILKAYGNNRLMVNDLFFKKYSSKYRLFDRDSIMMMTTIPREWLKKDSSFEPITKLNTNLSESDKALARQLYPLN